jgi:hypothetical protein
MEDGNNFMLRSERKLLNYVPCGKCPACVKIITSNNCNLGLNEEYTKIMLDQSVGKLSKNGYNIVDREGNPYHKEQVVSQEGVQLEIEFGYGLELIEKE